MVEALLPAGLTNHNPTQPLALPFTGRGFGVPRKPTKTTQMSYKKIQVMTKTAANKVLVSSLFKPVNGRTLTPERLDLGKYKVDQPYLGREVEVPESVYAVWMERRRDSDGPYMAAFCLSTNA